MALDPRIPLGIQPIQQPNMLAQMGQMMALKAAQQETEGYEGVRQALSGGAPDDPTKLLQYGKQGRETYKSLNEGRQKQLESAEKILTLTGQVAGFVRDSPTPENFTAALTTLQQNGILTPQQTAKVIADAGSDPVKIKMYADRAASNAIAEVDKMRDKTSRENNAATVGASYYSSNVSRDNSVRTDTRAREQMEFDRQKGKTIPGNNQFYREDVYGNIYPINSFGAQFGPNAPAPAMPPAAANAFVTTQPSVNALAPTAPPQGAGPTVANALAMDAQQNVPRPKQPIRQPVAIMGPDGKSILVPPEQAVGKQPATAFNESTAEKKAQLNRDLDTAVRNLELVVKPGGLLEKSTGSGAGRLYDASAAFFGKGTEGAIAGAQLAPIADMVLKMVPRFEGPQSNKDVDSYLAAAGKLADTGLPNDVRLGAAKVILKLMKERKGQFETKGQDTGGGGGGAPSSSAKSYSPQEQQALEWANANASDPRAAQIKQRLGAQ